MEPQEEHNEAEKGKRNMERLFDLQVFAQENTQTTGGLSAEMKTYYGMELLDNAKPQLVHNQFAATKPLAAARRWNGASSAPSTRRCPR